MMRTLFDIWYLELMLNPYGLLFSLISIPNSIWIFLTYKRLHRQKPGDYDFIGFLIWLVCLIMCIWVLSISVSRPFNNNNSVDNQDLTQIQAANHYLNLNKKLENHLYKALLETKSGWEYDRYLDLESYNEALIHHNKMMLNRAKEGLN